MSQKGRASPVSDSLREPQTAEVVPRQEHPKGGASPAARLVSELDGEYFMVSEVAEILGKDARTIRRAMYNKRVNAPSYETRQGNMRVYLYTQDDIQELRDYFATKIVKRKQD